MTSFFSAEGGPISIKFRTLVQNDMSTAVTWSKSKPDVELQYGGWNSYTLQCGMWLWNRDCEFTKWQHPAMWYWLWDDMPSNSPKRPPYWNSTWFPFPHITAVDMSFCTSLRNFIQIGPPSTEKMASCRFSRWRISAILNCRDPIMGSLKSPCTTSYT